MVQHSPPRHRRHTRCIFLGTSSPNSNLYGNKFSCFEFLCWKAFSNRQIGDGKVLPSGIPWALGTYVGDGWRYTAEWKTFRFRSHLWKWKCKWNGVTIIQLPVIKIIISLFCLPSHWFRYKYLVRESSVGIIVLQFSYPICAWPMPNRQHYKSVAASAKWTVLSMLTRAFRLMKHIEMLLYWHSLI